MNIIAFGNRAQMSGVEADTWVELKNRLGDELGMRRADAERQRALRAVDNDDQDAS